ncbi:MAG: BREX system ATP-binding domain-containing protein [Candidatus Saliniplasma sp.]
MVSSVTRERIFLHLSSYYLESDRKEVPYELTQPGIAEAIGVSRSHLSYEIRRIMDEEEGLIEEKVKHVEGLKRRRKVYFLTGKGIERARSLREDYDEKRVTLKTHNGKKEIVLGDIGDYLESENPLMTALLMVDDEGVINICEQEDKKEDIFVGRKDELERMREVLKDVMDGKSRTLFIVGEAGIGKTRLVSEFRNYTDEKGFTFLKGKAYFESSDPFLPFKKAFKGFEKNIGYGFKVNEPYPLPFLLERSRPKAENQEMFTSQRRAIFYETAQTIKKISEKSPLIIFIDDLQWADIGTLKLIHYLSENLEDSRVMLLGAFRPKDKDMNEFIVEIKRRMSRERNYDSIELEPLSWLQIREMISDLMGVDKVSSDFMNKLYEYCEGNPLFTEEYIKQLNDEDGTGPIKDLYPSLDEDLEMPEVITGIIERRFQQLSTDGKKILRYGSVIGEEVPYKILVQISEMEELDILDCVDELIYANLWSEDEGEDKLMFSHPLVKMAAYRSISLLKRKKLHERVANTLKKVYEDEIEEYYSDLAMHLEKCGRTEEAIEYYMLTGDRDELVYAHEEAIEMYKKALELVESEPKEDMKEKILERLADVYNVLGFYNKSEEYYLEAMGSTEEKIKQQRIYRKMADIDLKKSSFDSSVKKVDHGLNMIKTESSSEERCKLLKIKGWALKFKGKSKMAAEIFGEEMALAESLNDPKLIGEALHDLGTLHLRSGDYKNAEDHLKRSIEYRKEAGDERGLSKTYNNIAFVYKVFDDIDLSLEYSQKSLEIIKKIGDKRGMAVAFQNIGNLHFMKKEFKKAEDSHRRALEIFKRIDNQMGMAMAFDSIGLVYYEMGDMHKALEYHKKGLAISEDIGEDLGIALSSASLGTVLMEQDELGDALGQYERALEIFGRLGDKHNLAITEVHIGDIYLYRGDSQQALIHYINAKKILEEIEGEPKEPRVHIKLAEGYIEDGDMEKAIEQTEKAMKKSTVGEDELQKAKVHRIKGMLEGREENVEKSLEHFSETKELISQRDDKEEFARCLLEEGKILLKVGENKKGRQAIKESLDIYEDLGRTYWVSVCKKHL